MRVIFILILLLAPLLLRAELLDQIAIVVGKSTIKDSDIERDIYLNQFLDSKPAHVDQAARKRAAGTLIDQILIREAIRTGGYPTAKEEAVNSEIKDLETSRFGSEFAFQAALTKYHLDEAELRERLRWQLTVLQFIDSRFKSAAIIQDSAIEAYYREHLAGLEQDRPRASVEGLHEQVRKILVGEEVNRLLDSWLEEQRKAAKISFLESGLS